MSEYSQSKNSSQSESRRFDFVHITKSCPLSFNARLVYSFLLGRKSNLVGIANATGLDRHEVPTFLSELKAVGLAEKAGSKWSAITVHHEWFGAGSIRYHILEQESPLTPKQNAVYCQILALEAMNKPAKPSVIARLLGISRQTVYNAMKALTDLGLISVSIKTEPVANPGRFWQLVETETETLVDDEDDDQEDLKDWLLTFPDIALVGDMMQAGLSEEEVDELHQEAQRRGVTGQLRYLWTWVESNKRYGNGFKMLMGEIKKCPKPAIFLDDEMAGFGQ